MQHPQLRRAGAAVLAGHALVHLMGVALLWRLGQPGALRYADVLPGAGAATRAIAGAVWLSATLVLLLAARLLLDGRRSWRQAAGFGAVLSATALLPAAAVAPAGLVLDAVVLVLAVALTVRDEWSEAPR
ncbi:MAG: hypothetical protein JWM62_236 [Frankiales bacterium]|nr:hypothetical protein [Frankiales bacterium]